MHRQFRGRMEEAVPSAAPRLQAAARGFLQRRMLMNERREYANILAEVEGTATHLSWPGGTWLCRPHFSADEVTGTDDSQAEALEVAIAKYEQLQHALHARRMQRCDGEQQVT